MSKRNNVNERKKRIQDFKDLRQKLTDELNNNQRIKVKSKETLSNSIVELSKHIELLEGHPTDRQQHISEEERKSRINRLKTYLDSV